MPVTPHVEKHFTATETVRDIVIGMADGLTVPFALAAGLAAAVSSTHVIVTAGLSEIVAGAIAMGLGDSLAARTDAEHYVAEQAFWENWEIDNLRDKEIQKVVEIFEGYGLRGDGCKARSKPSPLMKTVVEFYDAIRAGLETPDPKRAPISARTIAVSYVVGGLIPLAPYIVLSSIQKLSLIRLVSPH